MQQFAPLEELFKGRHFDQEIVVLWALVQFWVRPKVGEVLTGYL